MEQEELKRKLFGLWEKTTHTSKEFIATLFDYYFNNKYFEYKEIDGKIVSAICGIPYYFGYGEKKLKGIYLMPLSSEEGFKKKGLLSELLGNINEKLKDSFDFSFLVPHTALLADYFGTLGYHSSFFILEERFTPLHDFKNDYLLSLGDSDERIKLLKTNLINEIRVIDNSFDFHFTQEELIQFIQKIENKGSSAINILHNSEDLEYLLLNNSVIQYNHFVAYDGDGRITGVSFIQKDDIKHIKISATYVSDICSYFVMLDYIKRHFPEYSMSVVTSDPKLQSLTLIQQNYASSNPNGGDLDNTFGSIEIPFNINKLFQPEGMVKILRFDNILNYLAETRSDADFKLYIRDLPEKIIFVIKNGILRKEFVSEVPTERNILNLSRKEVSELLLRKNDSSNLIMEAFGIPRLNLQFRLLPC